MTERLRRLDDDGLGRALATAGRDLDWPSAPDLTARVSATLIEHERHPSLARPRLSLPRRRRTVLLLVAGLLLLAAAAVAAKVVIDLGALTVDTIPGRPTALPTVVASGPTFGHRTTLEEAEREAGFPAQVPAALGDPDAVWVDATDDGSRIVLAWTASGALPPIDGLPWGAALYGFRGQMEQAAKSLFADGNTFEDATVDGQRRDLDHRPARARPGDRRRRVRAIPGHGERARMGVRRGRPPARDLARPPGRGAVAESIPA